MVQNQRHRPKVRRLLYSKLGSRKYVLSLNLTSHLPQTSFPNPNTISTESYNVTIPTCISFGQYLLRIQQLAIHNPYPAGIPQFYISCAQIAVTGGTGSGLKGTAVAIPGAFNATDPGHTVNIYNNVSDSYCMLIPQEVLMMGSFIITLCQARRLRLAR
jgi:hypothetical protein